MFARQSMTLLEFGSRLASADSTGGALQAFARELNSQQPRYFTRLPGLCASLTDFTLPYHTSQGDELLWALFDLVRHGHAHQYQQIVVELTNNTHWAISLTGAELGSPLERIRAMLRTPGWPPDHLGFSVAQGQVLWLTVRPEVLFVHLKRAIEQANLLGRGLSFPYLTRGVSTARPSRRRTTPTQFYHFDLASLETSLVSGGHVRL